MATDAEKVVTEFCNAWPRKNIEELLGFSTEDAVYHNIPL
jgi:limonene-1,2-epoxide hydrolase